MIDAALVDRKALLITRDLADLAPLAGKPLADYYVSFTQLAALGVYDADFGRRIAGCTGLRNRIVHEYDEVDPHRVHEALATATRDVATYLRAVQDYVKRTAGQ